MHFVGSPSKFLARDPISDCFSSRRRRASSLASTDTASLLVVRVRRGVPVHIVVQRARCTYLLFHYYYFSFTAAKYSNDTSFYKWAEKKWIMEKCQANIFEVFHRPKFQAQSQCLNFFKSVPFSNISSIIHTYQKYASKFKLDVLKVQKLCRCFRARLTVVQFYCPIVQMNDK